MARIAQVLKLPQYKMIEVICFEKYNELLKEISEQYSSDEIEDIAQIFQSINELIAKRLLK
jgi:hypothetical protein